MFLLVLVWSMAAFGHKSREERKRTIVSYGHLNDLKAAKKPLPLPGDLQYLWLDVTLHRMVQGRNMYISKCYAEGRRPVQPKLRHVEKDSL